MKNIKETLKKILAVIVLASIFMVAGHLDHQMLEERDLAKQAIYMTNQ